MTEEQKVQVAQAADAPAPAEEADAEAVSTVDEPVATEAPAEQEAATEAAPAEQEAATEAPAGDETTEEAAADEEEEAAEETPVNPNFKWYVVHTYSGYENRAQASLEERIRQQSMEEFFGEVLIPTENVVELAKGGQKKTSKRKFFPGYMLVQMELTDHAWHLVNDTPKITGFVGNATQPKPVPDHEVNRLTKQIDEGTLKAKPRVKFTEGEDVRVVDGAFANFNGVVETVNEDKGKVRVMVSIFGRSTPVELEFVQVEKA